jgi:hypothetical protein
MGKPGIAERWCSTVEAAELSREERKVDERG